MYGFFSGLFLLCCPLSQPVLVIICVFQSISVFIYGFRQVAVAVVSIRFRSSFRVGIRNQTVFRVIHILCFPDGIGFLFPGYQNGIRFTAIGKGILTGIVFGIFNCRYRYRQRTGHAGKLAHLVALLVINILDILCFFIFQTAFHLNEISLFIISILDFFVLVTLDLLFCFHEIAGFIIFVYYGLVTGTSVCLVLRKFFFDLTSQKVVSICYRHVLFDTARTVFFCNLSLTVIDGFCFLGLPVGFPFFSALSLGFGYISIFIVSIRNLCLIRRKPSAILIFFLNRVFFDRSAKVIIFIRGNGFRLIFSPKIGSRLGKGAAFGIRYGFCNRFT